MLVLYQHKKITLGKQRTIVLKEIGFKIAWDIFRKKAHKKACLQLLMKKVGMLPAMHMFGLSASLSLLSDSSIVIKSLLN